MSKFYDIDFIMENIENKLDEAKEEILNIDDDCPYAVAEIIRCEDCKHYKNQCCYVRYSVTTGGYILPVNPNDFCSRAERRETNERT